jgi:ABC-type Na+ efflux pump permease subunit
MMRVVWLLYSALGVLWLVFAFKVVVDSPANQEVIAMMCAFHVSVGLLLLSVNAATSLAEERVRGSLDALLCTPLSTRSILAGKWWGSFRQALPVLIWSVILAGILVLQSGHWVSYALLLGLIVADSAVITSLGLLIATWVSRLGRAVALCVSAYVVFTIGWLVLVFIVGGPDHFLLPLIMGSPPYGTGLATLMVAPEDNHFAGRGTTAIGFGALCWTAIDGVVAVLLFLTTSATFDRCLGRVSEAAGRPPSHPRSSTGARLDIPEWFLEDPDEGPGTIPR